MNKLEQSLIWLGVEDYTGLWEAVFQAGESGTLAPDEALQLARRTIESLSAQGLVELFLCPEPLHDSAVEAIPADQHPSLLHDDSSWSVPEEGAQTTLRFATTDHGFALYRRETGWAEPQSTG